MGGFGCESFRIVGGFGLEVVVFSRGNVYEGSWCVFYFLLLLIVLSEFFGRWVILNIGEFRGGFRFRWRSRCVVSRYRLVVLLRSCGRDFIFVRCVF